MNKVLFLAGLVCLLAVLAVADPDKKKHHEKKHHVRHLHHGKRDAGDEADDAADDAADDEADDATDAAAENSYPRRCRGQLIWPLIRTCKKPTTSPGPGQKWVKCPWRRPRSTDDAADDGADAAADDAAAKRPCPKQPNQPWAPNGWCICNKWVRPADDGAEDGAEADDAADDADGDAKKRHAHKNHKHAKKQHHNKKNH